MTVRDDILSFLRTPSTFCGSGDPAFSAAFARMRIVGLRNVLQATGDNGLRPAQERAWDGFSATRAGLLLGPPGTGKTHLLSYLTLGHVWTRAELGMTGRVFVTAFTRSAIENLLSGIAKRLQGGNVTPTLLYLGKWAGEPPQGVNLVDLTTSDGKDALRRARQDPAVIIGGTIWKLDQAIGSGLLGSRVGPTIPFFDLVAIDEASQMVLGQGLMALSGLAGDGRVIVAGDDRQLPPVRAAAGMAIDGREVGGSLYAFMKHAGVPEFGLEETFRLSGPLIKFPRQRFYGASYVSAVPDARIKLREGWEVGLADWERLALDPQNSRVVIVHDGPPAATESKFEVEVAVRLAGLLRARMLRQDGASVGDEFWSDALAVISPHRAQGAAIRARLTEPGSSVVPFVETVDRIQGKERDAVIFSYAVSDPEFAEMEADFIFSPERLNVGATRARSKLIVLVSRRLLDVVPAQQESLDKAEVLREFAFSAERALDARIAVGALAPVSADIRIEGFVPVVPSVRTSLNVGEELDDDVVLDPHLAAIMVTVERLSSKSPHGNAKLQDVHREASLKGGEAAAFVALRQLHALGRITLEQRLGVTKGTSWELWTATPHASPLRILAADDEGRLERIRSAVNAKPQPYFVVRNGFVWMDEQRKDILRPFVDAHIRAGEVRLETSGKVERLALPEVAGEVFEDLPPLTDDDYRVLNALEDLDAKRAAAGLFELWSHARELEAATGLGHVEVASAVVRLAASAHLMRGAEGRLRSRIGELAREIRHLKQRFAKDDADARPYLVRGVKMLLRDRRKPRRDHGVQELFGRVAVGAGAEVRGALDGLFAALTSTWGDDPLIAGFQARAFEGIFRSWTSGGDPHSFVISADTGSGKTEAMALPMIAGACVDALKGVRGTRAVLTYPRVRLVANQAERLAKYLAALAEVPGMPTLSLGVQFTEIPTDWKYADSKKGWVVSGDSCTFPLFNCPSKGCGGALAVVIGGGEPGCDRLQCASCGWAYRGWLGTKNAIKRNPPTFFLPTIDSLHGWLQDAASGAIFGDVGNPPPRALMADEIHLYSHIHGAQVGYAMRRLLFRCFMNAPDGMRPLAIGMSATLGDPGRTFGRLIGRADVEVVKAEEVETPVNPRGRESFLFIQPEIESRSKDVAGAATAIQSIMCLSHGMRRRTGDEGGFRSLVFLDSIDKVRRLHAAFDDAEGGGALAQYRTSIYPDDPMTGRPVTACCGDPANCHVSVDGECWWFAANDERQVFADGGRWRAGKSLAVAGSPVYSGNNDGVEQMIKRSDVVFATSSLEVGYDDPDIAFVFQHYAPQNLASFIQRKGRGGRAADDRPLTAVTLSMYSPRDSYWYARPELMLDANGFEAPLNPENHFVRRAHILSLALDAFAHAEAVSGFSPRGRDGRISDRAMSIAGEWVELLFGVNAWSRYGYATFREMWEAAEAKSTVALRSAVDARRHVPWIPNFLHETINLPAIEVAPLPGARQDGTESKNQEDIGLLLGLAAPGNISRRFDPRVGAWRPPHDGPARWLAEDDYRNADSVLLFGGDVSKLLGHLPIDARAVARAGIGAELVRPTVMTFEKAGEFSPRGSAWTPSQCFMPDGSVRSIVDVAIGQARAVGHRSEGNLAGTSIIIADHDRAEDVSSDSVPATFDAVSFFIGDGDAGETGLKLIRAYWGAEGKVVFNDRNLEAQAFTQTFVDPTTGLVALHGYEVESEGVRFKPDSLRLSAFVERIAKHADAREALRWRSLRCRLRCTSELLMAGVDRYSADLVGRLSALALTTPGFSDELTMSLRRHFGVDRKFRPLIERLVSERHQLDPMLTVDRVKRALDAVVQKGAEGKLQEALESVDRPEVVSSHLRSVVLHSLALRLREMFVLVSQGDERSVSVHVKLPVRFGNESDDVITVSETGQHGDGTTRAFRERFERFGGLWREGYPERCANAAEDDLVERVLTEEWSHSAWLATSPRDFQGLRAIRDDLGIGGDALLPAGISRMLFETLEVGGRSVRLFEVRRDARLARASLEAELGRDASGWELSSRLVSSKEARVGCLDDLFEWYGSVHEAGGEGSLSPRSRFAEQVESAAARLCLDGCSACVRQRSEIMPNSMADASVSRSLLARYIAATA